MTETAVIEDLPRASAWLQRARDAGMTIFLDDFGMGYCSLGVFAQLQDGAPWQPAFQVAAN